MKSAFRGLIPFLILCLLLSFGYAAIAGTHHCHADDCPICKIVAVLSVFSAVTCVFVAVALLFRLVNPPFVKMQKRKSVAPSTLILLRMKLSN